MVGQNGQPRRDWKIMCHTVRYGLRFFHDIRNFVGHWGNACSNLVSGLIIDHQLLRRGNRHLVSILFASAFLGASWLCAQSLPLSIDKQSHQDISRTKVVILLMNRGDEITRSKNRRTQFFMMRPRRWKPQHTFYQETRREKVGAVQTWSLTDQFRHDI